MQLGIWLPVYGGWLRTLDDASGPDVPACLAIAQQAEAVGFDFLYASENLLNCIHGQDEAVADAWSVLAAIAATTSRIALVGAAKPGFRSPFLLARMVDTLTQVARRRLAVNLVCGWWRREFELSGVSYLDHAGRYERADAFLRDFYGLFNPPSPIDDAPAESVASGASPPTYGLAWSSLPAMWVSGHSDRAAALVAEWGDCLFLNGMPDAQLERHIVSARQAATGWGREISIALNAYVIATETREQAMSRRDQIFKRRNPETIAYFRKVMRESGATAWGDPTDQQMVDSNAGFEAGLIGNFDDVRARLRTLHALGVDTVVCQFDDPMRDTGPFMNHVVRPLRAELGAAAPAGVPAGDHSSNHGRLP